MTKTDKIIWSALLIILAVLFFARSVQALTLVPFLNVNVTKIAVGGDDSFNFHLSVGSPIVFDSQDFQIDTVGGSGNQSINTTSGAGESVTVSEDPLDDWQNTSISCTSSNPQITFQYFDGEVRINGYPFSTVDCTFTNEKKVEGHNPVIIIPGILGSAEKNGVWVMDPIMHVYDNLIDTLKVNGYEEGKDLFTLPYDWHQSNIVTEVKLRAKIAEVENICSCNKIDLVAHSMGGLIARYYIESPLYGYDVDKLIFLGTPHLGAPESYLAWEAGESSPEFFDRILKFLLAQEAKKQKFDNLFDYIQSSVPSIGQLLPTYDYLKVKSSGELISYPDHYPRNYFLENLNDSVSTLLNFGVDIHNFVGDTGANTISVIRIASSTEPILWADGIPDGFYDKNSSDNGLERGAGDGTVPVQSASFIDSNLAEVNYQHTSLPTGVEGEIYKILTGKDVVLLENNWHFPDWILIIKMLSPADIQVVAPDGKVVGKDFENGGEINDIPGAFYSGFEGDDEYVTIPDPLPGDYVVRTQGTGSGLYTVASSLVSNDGSSEGESVGTTKPGFEADVPITVIGADTLEVDPPSVQAVTPDSVVADIEDAYAKGLIKSKIAKNSLERQIKAMVRIERKIEKVKERVKGKNIEKKILKLQTRIDRALAKALEKELQLYLNKKLITQEAYGLIKNDLELLIAIY